MIRTLICSAALSAPPAAPAQEESSPVVSDAKPQATVLAEQDDARRAAAVTLNYCRASLFRIRTSPTDRVLAEERRNILSNLNLAAIADEEVLRLYTDVLDEIAAVRIADTDRRVLTESHARGVARHATVTSFSLLAHAATADVAGAVRTGANSWWDLRGMQVDRDRGAWTIDRERVKGVLSKSGAFLDTSWKLARKRNIPDAWLVRDDDLRRLAAAEADPDPAARLRRLTRLERYLTHHPPYWYALARTQQKLGSFADAEATYLKLADLGGGHFRRDQMLAAGWANVAMIRDLGGDVRAADAAEKALACSGDAWEVNLAAAGVLAKHRRFAEAEDAVLRNLDADLEVAKSGAALCVVLAEAAPTDPSAGSRLADRLADETVVAHLPPAALVRCAAAVTGELPPAAADRLRASVSVRVADAKTPGVTLVADRGWDLPRAVFTPADDRGLVLRTQLRGAGSRHGEDRQTVRLTGLTAAADGTVRVAVRFAEDEAFTLTFAGPPEDSDNDRGGRLSGITQVAGMPRWPLPAGRRPEAPRTLSLAKVETAGVIVALAPDAEEATGLRAEERGRTRLTARPTWADFGR